MKRRYKKAASGLQDISIPEQGSYSNVLSNTASLAATGSQFGPIGGLLGGALGAGIGLLQKDKQDSANRIARATNKDRAMNRRYTGIEDTINQAPQRFKKGGRVKTKTIEIEGKDLPEIHTDKNFNVKNLGTIPHSRGGNKVEASEGDIVFNTQNSITKFNKIANAISNGDKDTLIAEKNKLPEDGGTKNQDGNKGVKDNRRYHFNSYGDKVYDDKEGSYKVNTPQARSSKSKRPASSDYKINLGIKDFFTPKSYTPDPKLMDSSGMNKASSAPTQSKVVNSPSTVTKPVTNKEVFSDGYKLPSKANNSPSTKQAIPKVGVSGKAIKKAVPISSVSSNNPLSSIKFNPSNNMEADLSPLVNSRSLDQVANSAKPFINNSTNSPATTPSSTTVPTKTSKIANGLNTGLQLTGVANNLFQGLKNEKGVDEKYYDPNLLKYNDRSNSLRKQSDQVANVQASNARNLSGGLVSNIRANQSAARIANLDRQGGIDEREQGRADAITNQNTDLTNQAKQINLGRKDQYDQLNYANRAAKQGYIDQASSDLGQLGMAKQEEQYMRSRDDKAYSAQAAGLKAINSITPNFSIDENGNRIFKSRYSKGTKGVKLSKYKTKK